MGLFSSAEKKYEIAKYDGKSYIHWGDAHGLKIFILTELEERHLRDAILHTLQGIDETRWHDWMENQIMHGYKEHFQVEGYPTHHFNVNWAHRLFSLRIDPKELK